MERYARLSEIKSAAVEKLAGEEEGQPAEDEVKKYFAKVEKTIVRQQVIDGKPRIDGRDNKTVRPIEVEVGVLPSTHGSALFTRGETQAIVTTTLGTARDMQIIDALEGERKDPFLFHYNFPPYSVGEAGRVGTPGRREVGHGRLAKRGVAAVMPTMEEFPYTIRAVSEITESNGSSSMASVCGSSLALMDAGVPIKAPVAGIAMGLVKEEDGRVRNVAYVFLRDGQVFSQPKIHPTPNEAYWWNITGGSRVTAIETDCGPIGVLVCYDAEFPELTRHLVDQGIQILFVPFCTDERQSYLRVRYCCQARAVENQLFVVMSGNVGNLPKVPNMELQYGQSCILTPCDFPFARDGIAADTTPNVETVAFADLRPETLLTARNSGTVKNLKDRRHDLYTVNWRGH